MPSNYTREEIRPNCVRFTVTPGWKRPVSKTWPIAAGIVFGLVVINSSNPGFFSHLFHLVFGIGGGWAVFRAVKWWLERRAATASRRFTFTVSADGALTEEGRVVQKQDITELSWTNFSLDGSEDDQCNLYCEVADRNQSALLATGMDESTAKRLAADVARILGVSFRGGTPEHTKTIPGVNDLATKERLAQEKFNQVRNGIGTTSDQESIRSGDTIIKETRRNVFALYKQGESDRDFLIDLDNDPHKMLFLAEDQAGKNNVWFEKVSGGPAILVPKDATNADAARQKLLDQLEGRLSPEEEERRAKARQKLVDIRAKFGMDVIPDVITTETQPMQPDDLILKETSPNVWEIQQIKNGTREAAISVPYDDLIKVFRFAHAYAHKRNLWLEKLSDKGPAVLMVDFELEP